MVLHKLFKTKKTKLPETKNTDFLELATTDPNYFARFEHILNHKPLVEINREIFIGQQILYLKLKEDFQQNPVIVLIPPKYEFWIYLFICIKLTFIGYRVIFLYHNWMKKIIDFIRPNLHYLRYQDLSFINIEEFNGIAAQNVKYLNLYQTYRGIKSTISGFSTVLITEKCDLDYAVAFIINNAFTFAGLKKSNIKRIIVDEKIKLEFEKKILTRIGSIDQYNASRIRSPQIKNQILETITDGVSEGADMIHGGISDHDECLNNFILTNVSKDSRIFQKLFYGPVLMITYTSFDPQKLQETIKQQPSKGIIIFEPNKNFIDLHSVSLRDYTLAIRPQQKKDVLVQNIVENDPTLEIVFNELGFLFE